MSGFIYIWYDRKHKRYYIGSHWGSVDDGYICSSNWMKAAFKRRPNDFKRRILGFIHTNRQELLDEEKRWLSMIKIEEMRIRYYNLTRSASPGREKGSKNSTQYTRESSWNKGKSHSPKHRENLSKAWIERKKRGDIRKGPYSEEKRLQIAEKRRTNREKRFKNNPSEEILKRQKISEKISKSGKGRTPWNKGKRTRRHLYYKNGDSIKWYNNGEVTCRRKEPPGPDWVEGRLGCKRPSGLKYRINR